MSEPGESGEPESGESLKRALLPWQRGVCYGRITASWWRFIAGSPTGTARSRLAAVEVYCNCNYPDKDTFYTFKIFRRINHSKMNGPKYTNVDDAKAGADVILANHYRLLDDKYFLFT